MLARYIPITELGNLTPRARRSLLRVPAYRDADTPADHLRGKVEFTYDFQNDTISGRYSLIAVQYDTEEDLLLEHSEQWVDMSLTRAFEGSFTTTRAELEGQTGNNRIEIAYAPAAAGEEGQQPAGQNPWRERTGCQDLCLVSVFHVQDSQGRIVTPPSTAYGDDFDPALFGGLSAHVAGYIVDAPLNSMMTGQSIHRPCMPTMATAPARITAEDQPNFVKSGYTAQFETNLVCLDARPITIYAKSLRWVFDPTPPAATRITRSGTSVDHTGSTAAFRQAVEAWLPLHGQ